MSTGYGSYGFDAERGFVIGKRGNPIRAVNGRGYVEVMSHGRTVGMAHRMIWESVHGPIPARLQINHINGVKTDNRIANLELVTCSENNLHKYRTGLASAKGERNGRAIGKARALAKCGAL